MENENKQEFHDLLTSLYSATRNSNSGKQSRDRIEIVLQEFLLLLGYDDQHLFNNVSVEAEDLHPIRDLQSERAMMLCPPPDNYAPEPGITFFFDILAARSVNSPPYLTVDTASLTPEDFEHGSDYISAIYYLNIRRETAGAHYSILFSDKGIVVVRPSEDLEAFRFRELERKDSERLYELLRAPDRYPRAVAYPAGYHPEQTKLQMFTVWGDADIAYNPPSIETEHCQLNLRRFGEILYEAEIAETKQEKGNALEAVATQLFSSFPYLSVRDENLYTKFGEIDLVIENKGTDRHTLFNFYSRFIIVECKHWIDPVPAKEIGHFKDKCNMTDVDLGIMFAWNGISGEGEERHAERMATGGLNGTPEIIVINSRDLHRVLEGTSFYQIIDEKCTNNDSIYRSI
ncbi:hypothetical protein [Halocatena pleomorpha]|uniref:Restriction endonuclease type IV Mrr domain-containing protein n=1 Tax=Halocatena pleomorpha TaxID=1785090 RepID=A0A3P3R842_9EURY|nr:hypothetical protein [Halocatena pleomorpha]RRJ28800.1 hypothetical protein EIK79_14860 [Halocatena pleomorpha]